MKTRIIVAATILGFVSWLLHVLTPVHPKHPEGAITVLKGGIPLRLP